MSHTRPKEYEFTYSTKINALIRDSFTCQKCHKHKTEVTPKYLEIHHIVPIWFALKFLPHLAATYFTSVDNAQCLCRSCHNEEHLEKGVTDYWPLAIALLGVNFEEHYSSAGD